MQLARKQNNISEFFSALLKSSLKLKHFQKMDDTHSSSISEITDSKKHC